MTRKQTARDIWPDPCPAPYMIDSDELVAGQEWATWPHGETRRAPRPLHRPVWVADLLDLPEPPRPTVTVDLEQTETIASYVFSHSCSDHMREQARAVLETCRQAREALGDES